MPGPRRIPSGSKRVRKRKKSSGFANARETAMYGGSRKSRQRKAAKVSRSLETGRRQAAVKKYRTVGPSKMSPTEQAIALRTLARRAATPEEWEKLRAKSSTDYALPGLAKAAKENQRLADSLDAKDEKPSKKRDDGGQSWIESLFFGSEDLKRDRKTGKEFGPTSGQKAYKALDSVKIPGSNALPGGRDPLTQKPSEDVSLADMLDVAALAVGGTGAALRAPKAARAIRERYGVAAEKAWRKAGPQIERIVGETGDSAAKNVSAKAARGTGIKGATGRATQRARQTVKPVTQSRPAQAARQGAQKAGKAKGDAAKAIGEATPKQVKAAGRSAGAPLRHIGRNKIAYGTLAATPAAVAAVKGKDPGKIASAPLDAAKGIVEGTADDPGQTAINTAAMVPGFITAAGGLVANLGLSTKRGLFTAIGRNDYSGAEIANPTYQYAKRNLKETLDFLETYGSGDVERIAKATSDKGGYGLAPLVVAAPPLARAARGPARKLVRDPLRRKAAERREEGKPRMFALRDRDRAPEQFDPDREIFQGRYEARQRGEVARVAGQRNAMISQEQRGRLRPILVPIRKANRAIPGKKLRMAREPGKGKAEQVIVRPADTLGLAEEFGIPRDLNRAAGILDDLIEKLSDITAGRVALKDADVNLRMPRPEMISTLEAARYMRENLPAFLENNSYWRAKEAWHNYVSDQGYSTRARYQGIAFLEDIPFPERRTPLQVQDIPDVPRDRAEARWLYLGERVNKAGKVEKRKAPKQKELDRIKKNIQKLQGKKDAASKAKRAELRAQAKALREEIKVVRGALATVGRKGYDKALLDEYTGDVRRVIDDDSYAEPGWRAHVDSARPSSGGIGDTTQPAIGGMGARITDAGRTAGDRFREGTLLEQGRIAENFETQIHASLLAPVAKRNIFALYRDVLGSARREYRGRTEFTVDEVLALVEAKLINPNDVALVPTQLTKRIWEDPTRKVSDSDVRKTAEDFQTIERALDNSTDLADFARRMDESERAKGALEDAPAGGRTYEIVPKETFRELVAQSDAQVVRAQKFMQNLNSRANRLILGTSPMWAAIQVVAETLQASVTASLTGIPTPASVYRIYRGKMLQEWNKLPDKQKWALASMAGESLGTKPNLADVRASLASGEIDSAAYAIQGMAATPFGRALKNVVTLRTLGDFDQWKGGLIRRGVAASAIDRELNGFLSNYRKAFFGSKELYEQMRGMSRQEQLAYLAENPPAARKVMGYLEDTMGEWRALTSRERGPAAMLAFYPFLRMSLRVFFRGLPRRHPFKTSMLYLLGTVNAQVLEDFLHGDPSYFSQWAKVPLYGGDDGEITSSLDLARAAPAANALLEALGDPEGLPWSLFRVASPALGPMLAAAAGITSFGQIETSGLSTAERIQAQGLAGVAQLLSMAAPLRLLDQTNVGVESEKLDNEGGFEDAVGDAIVNFPVLGFLAKFLNQGEGDSELSALNRKLGPDGAELFARNIIPFIPVGVKEDRIRSQLDDLITRISRKPEMRTHFGTILEAAKLAARGDKVPAQKLRATRIDAQRAQNALDRLLKREGVEQGISDPQWDWIQKILGEVSITTDRPKPRRKVRRKPAGPPRLTGF